MNKISLPKNLGIAIQGPTNYYKEISAFYKQFDAHIVFTTWKNEPSENVLYLERSGIHMELIDAPKYNGYLNVNMQNASSAHGLKYLKEQYGVTEALKIRSDSMILGVEKLWQKLYGCEISWAHIYNPKADTNWAYNLFGTLHVGMDWTVDYAVFGKIDNLIQLYDWNIPYNYPVPPESMYMIRWLNEKKLNHDFSPEYLKDNGAIFFAKYFVETGSDLYCMKYNQSFRNLILSNPYLRLV